MRSFGERVDAEGIQHAPVSDALVYDRKVILWTRRIGTGIIVCEQLRANRPGRRMIRLTATYLEGDCEVTTVCGCNDELDEARAIKRLETRMLAAQIRPVFT